MSIIFVFVGDTGWEEYRTILAEEMRYDGSLVVYQVIGLNAGEVYRFRVKSQTRYGISAFSESSKPITACKLNFFGQSFGYFLGT